MSINFAIKIDQTFSLPAIASASRRGCATSTHFSPERKQRNQHLCYHNTRLGYSGDHKVIRGFDEGVIGMKQGEVCAAQNRTRFRKDGVSSLWLKCSA